MQVEINIGYFNFRSISRFEEFRSVIGEFEIELRRHGVGSVEFQLRSGAMKYPDLNYAFKTFWRNSIPHDCERVSVALEYIIGSMPSEKSEYISGQNTFLDEIKRHAGHLKREMVPKLIMLDLEDEVTLGPLGNWHGFAIHNLKAHASFIAMNRLYPQLVFHELAHILGADEGYDDKTLKTLSGCEKCWMQFNPGNGTGWCNRHLVQISDFLKFLER